VNFLDGLGDAPTVKDPSSGSNDLLNDVLADNPPDIVAFEKNGLKIDFSFERTPNQPSLVTITLAAHNNNSQPLNEFVFQAAVPRSFQLQMLSPSGNVVPGGNSGTVTQVIKVNNLNNQPLRMRIRVNYNLNGVAVTEQSEVNNFPSNTWQ